MIRTKNEIVIRGGSSVSLNDRFSELLEAYSPPTSDPDPGPFNMNPRRLALPRKSVTRRLGRTDIRSRLGTAVWSKRRRPVWTRLGRPVWTRLGRSVWSKRRRPVWTRLGHPAGSRTWFRPWLQRSWLRGRVFSLGGLWWNGPGCGSSMYSNKRFQRAQKPWAERRPQHLHNSQGECERCTYELSCQAPQTPGGGGVSFGTKVPRWKSEVTDKEDLDKDLDDYMSSSKRQLDKDLDNYMTMAGDIV